MFQWFNDLRRRQIIAHPFPDEWQGFLTADLPHWGCLNAEEQQRLREHVQIFIAEKRWETAAGLTLTDEIKVTIAANACLLLLGLKDHDFYPNLRVIIVYPSAFYSREQRRTDAGAVNFVVSGRLGEAWTSGQVILSWNSVKRDIRCPDDGHNVVLHEFAHILDMRDGRADGVPRLPEGQAQYDEWATVMEPEYQRLRLEVAEGEIHILDGYGATEPAEFFAVATECFFERPIELKDHHPSLYDVLARYFRQDTAARAQLCALG